MDKQLGMYGVGTPGFPEVRVGKFIIARQDDKSVWIQHDDGEGGQFPDDMFEAAVFQFFQKYF